ncbi:DUF6356 family protein [Sneathiella glossodoripedis]|uniref:DUF6356 family protein n=1 Tax=Sneathiella glossodoripedis TaxID=418853 RepID=UPI000470AC38|nr:DUF6356 family protein [Sneathiella glossodoripedis]
MQNPLNLFTDHPSSVNETYLEHMQMSGGFGIWLLLAALCAFIHALLPFAFEKTAGGIIRKLYSRMVSNRVVKTSDKGDISASDAASFFHI